MYELSLFSGAGGGLLGTHLLGWTPVGYVEWNDYCQRVIAARIRDGILPNAPIFGDIRAFIREGYASAYQGLVDVVTGGFPCQPFSTAGKRLGADDARNMWPATIDTIRTVRPRFCFLENVPGLLSSGYFGTILGDLAESGYDCKWRILSASECGAPHKRDRLWIVVNSRSSRFGRPNTIQSDSHQQWNSQTRQQAGNAEQGVIVANCEVANTQCDSYRSQKNSGEIGGANAARPTGGIGGSSWWATEPDVGRVAYGVAARVDRLTAIGNGQVPAVVRAAWELLAMEASV